MFKKFITGIMAGIIVIAVVMTAGCVSSTIVADDEVEQIEEQAPVEIVCAQDKEDEPVWFGTSFQDKKSDSVCEEVTPDLHFKKPSHAIVTSTCVKSEVNHRVWEDPVWEDPGRQYQGVEPTRTKAWFGINEPVEGAGLEGDPWLYEPVEPTGTKAWYGIDPHDEAHLQPLGTNSSESEEFPEAPELNEQPKEKKDQSVKFPGHQFKGSVPEDEYKHKFEFDIKLENEREASEKEPVGESAEDEIDQKSDEEKVHTPKSPSRRDEVVTNCAFNPNQAGHDGGAILNPDKDRHADKGFDEGSFARAA